MIVNSCETVCLALGPYRNLTTLTASTLFLHPNCQVLNHAGQRIFDSQIDFLKFYSRENLDRFIANALDFAAGGERGNFGGSITLSHAFGDKYRMKEIFQQTGMGLVKDDVRALFWKESHKTSSHIRRNVIELDAIMAADSRLKFLFPVRNPIHCAISNINTGHTRYFDAVAPDADLLTVIAAVLDEYVWIMSLKKTFPERFFHFFEHSITAAMLANLEEFLALPHSPQWIDLALSAMQVESTYRYPAHVVDAYESMVSQKFHQAPEFAGQLLAFRHSVDN
jgi:hypothetical protein